MLFGSAGAAGTHRGRAGLQHVCRWPHSGERTLHAAQVRSLLRAVGAHLVSLRLTEEADGAEYAGRRLRPMACLPYPRGSPTRFSRRAVCLYDALAGSAAAVRCATHSLRAHP